MTGHVSFTNTNLWSVVVPATLSISVPGSDRFRVNSSREAEVLKVASSCWAAVPPASKMGCWSGGDHATFTVLSTSFTLILTCNLYLKLSSGVGCWRMSSNIKQGTSADVGYGISRIWRIEGHFWSTGPVEHIVWTGRSYLRWLYQISIEHLRLLWTKKLKFQRGCAQDSLVPALVTRRLPLEALRLLFTILWIFKRRSDGAVNASRH
jgi:hypothetical protein